MIFQEKKLGDEQLQQYQPIFPGLFTEGPPASRPNMAWELPHTSHGGL